MRILGRNGSKLAEKVVRGLWVFSAQAMQLTCGPGLATQYHMPWLTGRLRLLTVLYRPIARARKG